jgi:hypothetical protein
VDLDLPDVFASRQSGLRIADGSQKLAREYELMKSNHKLVTAVLAGVAIGVAGAHALRAQQNKTPPGYVIAEVDVTEPDPFKKYAKRCRKR